MLTARSLLEQGPGDTAGKNTRGVEVRWEGGVLTSQRRRCGGAVSGPTDGRGSPRRDAEGGVA